MSLVIDFPQDDTLDRHQRWDRFERADQFEHYRKLHAQGVSQRQAAKQLQVPRTTLQAWRIWHDTLDICPVWLKFSAVSTPLKFLRFVVYWAMR